LDDVGVEPLVNELNIGADLAEKLVTAAHQEATNLAAESKKKQAEKEMAEQTNTLDQDQKQES
jgi:hypothetical protein